MVNYLAEEGVSCLLLHLGRGEGLGLGRQSVDCLCRGGELGQEVLGVGLLVSQVLGLEVFDPLLGTLLGLVEELPATWPYLASFEVVCSEETRSVLLQFQLLFDLQVLFPLVDDFPTEL